jgi:hypothetical protein
MNNQPPTQRKQQQQQQQQQQQRWPPLASDLVACGSSGSGGTAFPALYLEPKGARKAGQAGAWPCPKNNAAAASRRCGNNFL